MDRMVHRRWLAAIASLASLGAGTSACSILFDARDQASNYAATRNDAAPGLPADSGGGGGPDGGGGSPDGSGGKNDGGGPKDVGTNVDAGSVPDSGVMLTCESVDAGCVAPSSGGVDRSFNAQAAGNDLRMDTLMCPVIAFQSFTIEFWIKYAYAGANVVRRSIISQQNVTDGWNIILDANVGAAGIGFQWLAAGVAQTEFTARVLAPNVWHHVAIEGTTTNGALVHTTFLDGAVRPDRTFQIGAIMPSGPSLAILGNVVAPYLIDEVRISTVERYPHGLSFAPPKVTTVDANTLGRWSMDESDMSLTASDSACRHHGTASRLMSFVTDAPM
jgi:hypothetical protein